MNPVPVASLATSVEAIQQKVFATRMVLKASLAGDSRLLRDRLQVADACLVEVMGEMSKLQDAGRHSLSTPA